MKSMISSVSKMHLLAASLMISAFAFGCNENDSANKSDSCNAEAECANRQDGKTHCDLAQKICVKPDETLACKAQEECANRQDGKTYCDIANSVCIDPASKTICGNDKLENGEECDKAQLDNKTCSSLPGFIGGSLSCNSACKFNTSQCIQCSAEVKCPDDKECTSKGLCVEKGHIQKCGDDIVEGNEECDGTNLNGVSCGEQKGFVAGKLSCDDHCAFDTSECVQCTDQIKCPEGKVCRSGACIERTYECGDGYIDTDKGEVCDSENLDGKTCTSFPEYIGGTLACNKSCKFNKLKCFKCTQDDMSKCKEGQICNKNNKCADPGHVVACKDNEAEDNEACDGTDLKDMTCADLGFSGGELKCKDDCTGFDTTGCVECTEDIHCADKPEGKISCDKSTNTCIKPEGGVVISQIYISGGNGGAVYKTRYVELFNRGVEAVDISKWSIQYGTAKSDTLTNGFCTLPSNITIPAGGYYLIAFKTGKVGSELIQPDHVCETEFVAAESGKFFLVSSSTKLSSLKPESGYVDAIGYGSANWSEGNSPADALSPAKANVRNHGGCDDTNVNKADFTAMIPVPRNSSSPKRNCLAADVPENDETKCKDNQDNDGDSLVDCADKDCQSVIDCSQAESGATACSDRIDNDGNGKVDCYDPNCKTVDICMENTKEKCEDEIDNDGDEKVDSNDSDCDEFYTIVPTCTPEQDYIEKYNVCANKITSLADLIELRDKWNSEGAAGYSALGTAFILKNDIDIGTNNDWVGIGDASHPFNGILIGNNKKISGTLKCTGPSCSLFTVMGDAKIYDLKLDLNIDLTKDGLEPEQYVSALASKIQSSEKVIIENLTINAELKLINHFVAEEEPTEFERYHGCVFGKMEGGHLEMHHANIQCSLNSDLFGDIDTEKHYKNSFTSKLIGNYAGIGCSILASANISDIRVELTTTDMKLKGEIYSGGARTYLVNTYLKLGGYFAIAEGPSQQKPIVFDHADCSIKITNYSKLEVYDDHYMPAPFASSIKNVIARNFRVVVPPNSCTSCKSFVSVLAVNVQNSSVANFDTSQVDFSDQSAMPYSIKGNKLINGYVPGREKGYNSEIEANNYYSMLYSTNKSTNVVDEGQKIQDASAFTAEQVVNFFNGTLNAGHSYFSSGKYLPWFVDSNGHATLKFNATESEMVTVPQYFSILLWSQPIG